MQAISTMGAGVQSWQAGAERRLRASMVVSAVVLAAALSIVRLPSPASAGAADDPLDDAGPVDREPLRVAAIRAVLDAAERLKNYSVNPPFERARREAAVRFRTSLAPEAVRARDRTEKDQLGRAILRLGDDNCLRVLDDPSGVNRWRSKRPTASSYSAGSFSVAAGQ